MPLIDLWSRGDSAARSVASSAEPWDVCIVGTGPAGATMAQELSASRLRVLVLESGAVDRESSADRLNDVVNVGRDRNPDQWSVRNRILGGSSHTWGGRCAPFDEIDFEERAWVPESGWPFGPAELDPFLRRSAEHLGLADGVGFSDDSFWAVAGREAPRPPDPDLLRTFVWQFSRDDDESYPYEYMRFGRHLVGRLGPHVTLVLGATATRLVPVDGGTAIESVEFSSPSGERFRAATRSLVLATGGIENARLLLASGVGNDRDLVGRYLMDHLRGPVGAFDILSSEPVLKRLGRYNVRGHLYRAGFRLSPEIQRREQLLNCAAWLGEEVAENDPWDAMRRLIRREGSSRDLRAVASGLPLMARASKDYFIDRNGVPRRLQGLSLLAMVEQRPDPESRVTLADQVDRFSVPLPKVDWRVHPDESRTMRRVAELVSTELASLGFVPPELLAWVRDGADVPDGFLDVAHPIGTTRMATDPQHGVVDGDCQVHGVAGLYVAGSSVMPTGGHCNPTQTIVALAIRLAEHLETSSKRTAVSLAPSAPVLVTGGTGRVGSVLLSELVAQGRRVRATTSQSPLPVTPGVEWVSCDFLTAQPQDFDELVAGCDAVLHLAAEIGHQDRMQAVNVDTTEHLAAAAEAHGVAAFVYVSTVSVYGSGKSALIPEGAPTLTVENDVPGEYLALGYVRAYGRTKLAGELAIRKTAADTPYVVLRPAVIVDVDTLLEIGDWSRAKRILAAHRHAHHVYVRDVVDVIMWAMDDMLAGNAEPGSVATYNVAEDERPGATHRAFLRKALEATGDRRFHVPPLPGLVDWLQVLYRARRLSLRKPLWRMRFPDDALLAAGYHRRHGMRTAENLALRRLRER